MLGAAFFALTFFIIYSIRTIFIGNTDFGGPDSVRTYYKIFLIFHVNLATIGGVLGLVQIITAFKDKFKWHEESDLSLQLYMVLYWHYRCGSILIII